MVSINFYFSLFLVSSRFHLISVFYFNKQMFFISLVNLLRTIAWENCKKELFVSESNFTGCVACLLLCATNENMLSVFCLLYLLATMKRHRFQTPYCGKIFDAEQ